MFGEYMARELDLSLVNTGARKQVYGSLAPSLSGIEPPLWCGLIAAFIRKHGYSVKIIDAEAGEDIGKRDYIVSNEKIESTGFKPEYSLHDGISELIKGYQVLKRNQYANI